MCLAFVNLSLSNVCHGADRALCFRGSGSLFTPAAVSLDQSPQTHLKTLLAVSIVPSHVSRYKQRSEKMKLLQRIQLTDLHVVQQHACRHHSQPSQQVWRQHLETDPSGRLSGGEIQPHRLQLYERGPGTDFHAWTTQLFVLICTSVAS